MITGTAVFDLRDAEEGRMRQALDALPDVPTGAAVIVQVGELAPEPTVVRVLAEHQSRLQVTLHGTPYAVSRWLAVLRAPVVPLLSLVPGGDL